MKKRLLLLTTGLSVMFLLFSCESGRKTVDAESLELSVRNILELPTYEEVYRDIVYIGEEQKVLFFTTTDKRLLFSVDIRLQAGIKNLEKIKIQLAGTDEEGTKQAIVYIPHSEVLLADADENTIEQYFLKEQGGEISRLEYYNEINRKKEGLIKSAVDSGLLVKADTNARKLIQGFMELSDIQVIEFRELKDEG